MSKLNRTLLLGLELDVHSVLVLNIHTVFSSEFWFDVINSTLNTLTDRRSLMVLCSD